MTASLVCTEETVRQVQRYAEQLYALVCQYRWITESYVVEFFVKDHWGRLPPSWQHCLASLAPPNVAQLLLSNPQSTPAWASPPPVWPLSLLAFRAATHALALRRTVGQPAQVHPQSGRNPDLSHCYRAHVKPKKQHEIERLAEVIHTTSKQVGCDHVVDIGSGQGHLSRLLSFGYGHRVTSIEAVDCHVAGAAKFDQEVKAYFERKAARARGISEEANVSPPHHVVCSVHPYITVEEFLSVISARTKSNQNSEVSHSGARVDHSEHPQWKRVHRAKKMKMGAAESDASPEWNTSKVDSGKTVPRITSNICRTSSESISNLSPQVAVNIPTSTDPKAGLSAQNASSTSCQDCISTRSSQSNHLDEKPEQNEKFLVTGLHTCGDLGPTMLRTFAECPLAVALASVACCYMRMSFCDKSLDLNPKPHTASPNSEQILSTSTSSSHRENPQEFQARNLHDNTDSDDISANDKTASGLEVSFPMSNHVKTLCSKDGTMLTFEPLELACHFFEGYRERLKDNDPSLITQGYRAVLEVLIQEQDIKLTRSHDGARTIRKAVGSVKRAHQLNFDDYASSILGKLGLRSDPDRIRTLGQTLLPRWHNLVTYHSIRQLLAPIVESLVLVDRALFLLEQGIESHLVPIFDPLLSPRNLVLLAIKKSP